MHEDVKTDGEPIHFVECFTEYHNSFFTKEMTNSFHRQGFVWEEEFDYVTNAGINVIGTAVLDYAKERKNGFTPETRVIELMKDVDNLWVASQFHGELSWENDKAGRSVLDAFKHMLGIEVEQ